MTAPRDMTTAELVASVQRLRESAADETTRVGALGHLAPELARRLEAAERVVMHVTQVMVDHGPVCLGCAEDIETDTDPCEPGCAGHETRKAVVAYRALSSGGDDGNG